MLGRAIGPTSADLPPFVATGMPLLLLLQSLVVLRLPYLGLDLVPISEAVRTSR